MEFPSTSLFFLLQNLSTVKYPDPDVQLNHQGYLMMATEKGAELLMNNYNLQMYELMCHYNIFQL